MICHVPAVALMASKTYVTGPHGNDCTKSATGTSNGSSGVVATRYVSSAKTIATATMIGHSQARALARQVGCEPSRADDVLQAVCELAEGHVLGGVSEHDGLAEQPHRARLDEDVVVHAAERDRAHPARARDLDRGVHLRGQPERPGE